MMSSTRNNSTVWVRVRVRVRVMGWLVTIRGLTVFVRCQS